MYDYEDKMKIVEKNLRVIKEKIIILKYVIMLILKDKLQIYNLNYLQ